jgi:hypothetical protein
MRELTICERDTLARRREEFPAFIQEMSPVLTDFAERLGLQKPHTIMENPETFLETIEDFLKDQIVTEEDRAWIVARLAYFIGQIFIQRFGGEWLLNEHPNSKFFLQYVVGRFPIVPNENATVDPFAVAISFLAQPVGRSLERSIAEAEREILSLYPGAKSE